MASTTFSVFRYFVKNFPIRTTSALILLIAAGLVETVGISALLPLLNTFLDSNTPGEPNFLTQLTDTLFNTLNIEQNFRNLLIVVVVTISLKAVIIYHALKIVSFAATDITKDLRTKLINALINAKWSYYTTLPIGQSATSIANEAENASHFFTMMGKSFAAFIQAIIYIYIAIMIDWKISLFAIIFGGMSALLMKSLVIKAKITGTAMADNLTKLIVNITEALSGAKAIKAMGQEKHFINLIQGNIQKVNEAKKQQLISNLLLQAFHEPALVIIIALGIFWAHTYSNYPLAELFLIGFLFQRLISQINMLQNTYQKTLNFEGSVKSILSATSHAEENIEKHTGAKVPNFKDKIIFNNVNISYGSKKILTDFSNEIRANKITLLFGPSGVGKCTLLDSLLGFIHPQSGSITIDDINIKDIDIQKWRESIGFVPQDTFLFNKTIYENITLGDSSVSEDDVLYTLDKTNALSFVQELENGIHFHVGEKGNKLSGGQKQRLAMARSIVRKPKILILDESTTGLDKENEKLIIQTLKLMSKSTTIIIISHEPSMRHHADHIIDLSK